MPKESAAELGKRAWNLISHFDTLSGLVGWVGGSCLGSILASRWWLVNPFVAMAWFFGTIFVTVLTVKALNFCWFKLVQPVLPWLRRKRHAHGGQSTRASSERDTLLKQLSECKRSFGVARLQHFSGRDRASIEKARLDGHDKKDVRVTIRFAPPYDEDYTLVKEIAAIVHRYLRWPVNIDGTNNPLIEPSITFRVRFDASFMAPSFEEVAAAFQEGELINGKVGFKTSNRDDDEHLIIEVAPRLVKQ